jgi:hypothetical protein
MNVWFYESGICTRIFELGARKPSISISNISTTLNSKPPA